jgi:TatA/E family protein of Tat protein translocase
MFENLGPAELLVIFLVILIFFGPKKIPELASSLGKGLRKFNSAKEGFETHVKTAMKEPMDALNDAKAGFQAKLMDASAPLRETLVPPANLQTTVAPPPEATLPQAPFVDPNIPPAPMAAIAPATDAPLFTPPPESLPRGSSLEEPPTSAPIKEA